MLRRGVILLVMIVVFSLAIQSVLAFPGQTCINTLECGLDEVCDVGVCTLFCQQGDAACSDGVDNDLDGQIDYPDDPECRSPLDNDEESDPQCADGIDNDLDGFVDFPEDLDCVSPGDETEGVVPGLICTVTLPTCGDGVDNDGDELIDYREDGLGDPDCASYEDEEVVVEFAQLDFEETTDDLTTAPSGEASFSVCDPACSEDQVCDAATRTCVECSVDDDSLCGDYLCDLADNTCGTSCVTLDDCQEGLVCDTGECVDGGLEVSTTPCSEGCGSYACNEATDTCVRTCSDSSGCAEGAACDDQGSCNTCHESDIGINYELLGTATGVLVDTDDYVSIDDVCIDDTTLHEYSCLFDGENTYVDIIEHDCAAGSVCEGGVCVSLIGDTTCPGPCGDFRCDDDSGFCFESCVSDEQCLANGVCSSSGECHTCQDSDLFANPTLLGVSSGVSAETDEFISVTDECIDATTVRDYECVSHALQEFEVSCESGQECIAGVCVDSIGITGSISCDERCGDYECNEATGTCYEECFDESACAEGAECVNNVCEFPEGVCNPNDCYPLECSPSGVSCLADCDRNEDCQDGLVCNLDLNECVSCIDTDPSEDLLEGGIVTIEQLGENYLDTGIDYSSEAGDYVDFCEGNLLRDYKCNVAGTSYTLTGISCDTVGGVCVDDPAGAKCEPLEEAICEDPDEDVRGTSEYQTYTVTVVTDPETGENLNHDGCGPGGLLYEYYCDGNVAVREEVDCAELFGSSWVCEDGACVDSSIISRGAPSVEEEEGFFTRLLRFFGIFSYK